MKKLILALSLLVGACGQVRAQTSCLAYFDSVPDPAHRYPGGWEAGNPDSVLLDTCASSATYGELFVAKWIAIQFQYHILPTPPGPADTIIEVGWQAIDTNYTATRNAFAAIEAKYGSFVLRKASPEISDTSSDQSNEFAARFDGDVCADSVLKDFQAIPLEKQIGLQDGLIGGHLSIPSIGGMVPGTSGTSWYLHNQTESFYPPSWHRLGWEFNLYQIKCPMAWEITMGKPSIFILNLEARRSSVLARLTPDVHDISVLKKRLPSTVIKFTNLCNDTFNNVHIGITEMA